MYDGEIRRIYENGENEMMTGVLIERCAPGYFGSDCNYSCDKCGHGTCSDMRDGCICDPGYTGILCKNRCSANTYGPNCEATCQCRNGGQCDHVDGTCKCPPGVGGEFCEDGCPAGFWGESSCEKRCKVGKLQCNKLLSRHSYNFHDSDCARGSQIP